MPMTPTPGSLLFLSRREVDELLDLGDCIAAVAGG